MSRIFFTFEKMDRKNQSKMNIKKINPEPTLTFYIIVLKEYFP